MDSNRVLACRYPSFLLSLAHIWRWFCLTTHTTRLDGIAWTEKMFMDDGWNDGGG